MRYCTVPTCKALVTKGRCAVHARAQEQARPNTDVRAWYHTPAWLALRRQVKDEQPFCDDCEADGVLTPWDDLDHTVPHRGDHVLFFSRSNVRGKCKRHHAQKTRRGL